ncbi:MAG: hypothetical protein AAGF78_13900 [Pseudomonadota bacterium]
MRIFVTLSAALIAGIYLQPDWAVELAGLMPAPLATGAALCAANPIFFAARYLRHRRPADTVPERVVDETYGSSGVGDTWGGRRAA